MAVPENKTDNPPARTSMPSSPRAEFTRRFDELYAAAGNPSLRRVAAAANERMRATRAAGSGNGVGSQRISDWKSGRNLPARFDSFLPVLLTLIDKAKSSGTPVPGALLHVVEWRKLWETAVAWEPEAEHIDAACPYLGLSSYHATDADRFFGREEATNEFVDLVRDAGDLGGLVVLVGSSGAGKSSLLQAGLVPTFANALDEWSIVAVTPGATPTETLRKALAATQPDDRHRLVVIDQFEELFTVCDNERERKAFVELVNEAGARDGSRCVVVAAIRADFFARCLDYPILADALRNSSYLLGPMTIDELAQAITKPAELAGLKLAAGLEELVISELRGVGGHDSDHSYDPGALPLLSHVMEATWQRRENRRLTIAGYRKAGGVVGSVATTAEQAWSALSDAQQGAASQLLLGLVTVGHDSRDTRRRVSRDELLQRAGGGDTAEAALEALVHARLVTLDADTAYLTHEIVLEAWPRLRAWIDEDRVGYLINQRMETDAAEWNSGDRDHSLLYRGARLTAAENAGRTNVTRTAHEFLSASLAARQRAGRRATITKAVVATLGVVVVLLSIAAYGQSRTAWKQRDDAVFASLLSEADRLQGPDPSTSAQLDLIADRLRPEDPQVRSHLLGTQDFPLATVLAGHTDAVNRVTFRPDGKVLASAGNDETIRLWDTSDSERPRPLGQPLAGHHGSVTSAAFRPDGNLLASAGEDHTVRLWDIRDPANARPVGTPLGGTSAVYSTVFSPDGRILAAAHADGTVALWDIGNPAAPQQITSIVRHDGPARAVAFSPDGKILATSGDDLTVRLWNLSDPQAVRPAGPPLVGFGSTPHAVAFSPDGVRLAVAADDGTARLWNVADPAGAYPLGDRWPAHRGQIETVAFGPDGQTLVTGSVDGTARIWALDNPPRPPRPLGLPLSGVAGAVHSVAVGPDGRTVATGCQDGAVRLWSLPVSTLSGHSEHNVGVRFSADGAIMATGARDGSIRLWDTRSPSTIRKLGGIDFGPPTTGFDLSPDGKILVAGDVGTSSARLYDISNPMVIRPAAQLTMATGYQQVFAFSPDSRLLASLWDNNSIMLWDISNSGSPRPLGTPVHAADKPIAALVFSPDGSRLATAATDRTVRLWDVSDPNRLRQAGPDLVGHAKPVTSVAFSPDGHTLAASGEDGTVRFWDISDSHRPAELGSTVVEHHSPVLSIAFSPDGHSLATAGNDGPVRLWNVTDRGSPTPLGGSIAPSGPDSPKWTRVLFHPAGAFMAAAGDNGALRLWDLDPDHAVARICATTPTSALPQLWRDRVPHLPYRSPCP